VKHPSFLRLDLLLSDALPAEERAVLDAHFAVCPRCAGAVANLRSLRAEMVSRVPAPGALRRSVVRWRWLLLAAALVALIVLGILWSRP
jgi:anti-sigma factor RsiW